MKELQELIDSITKLVTALGPLWTLVILAALIGYHRYREYLREQAEQSIADEKEKQIQRLADDNRWMRQVLMEKVMGFSAEEAKKITSQGQTTPLLSAAREKERV